MSNQEIEPNHGFGFTVADNAHLRLSLLEESVNKYLGQIKFSFSCGFLPEFGNGLDKSIVDNLEDLLNHLSFVRVAKIYNDLAERNLEDFKKDNKAILLEDAYSYLSTSVSVSPAAHVERVRALTLTGDYYKLLGQLDESHRQIQEAFRVLQGLKGADELVERARKVLHKKGPAQE